MMYPFICFLEWINDLKWISFIMSARKDFDNASDFMCMCEKHFDEACYPLKYKLLKGMGKGDKLRHKWLLPDAVPTIHLLKPEKLIPTSQTKPAYRKGEISRCRLRKRFQDNQPDDHSTNTTDISVEVNLTETQVKNRITNRKINGSGRTNTKYNQLKGSSAYNNFCKDQSSKGIKSSRLWSRNWKKLSEKEQNKFNRRPISLNKKSDDDKKRTSQALLKQLDTLLKKLSDCDIDMAAVGVGADNVIFIGPSSSHILQLLQSKEEEFMNLFLKKVNNTAETASNTNQKSPSQVERDEVTTGRKKPRMQIDSHEIFVKKVPLTNPPQITYTIREPHTTVCTPEHYMTTSTQPISLLVPPNWHIKPPGQDVTSLPTSGQHITAPAQYKPPNQHINSIAQDVTSHPTSGQHITAPAQYKSPNQHINSPSQDVTSHPTSGQHITEPAEYKSMLKSLLNITTPTPHNTLPPAQGQDIRRHTPHILKRKKGNNGKFTQKKMKVKIDDTFYIVDKVLNRKDTEVFVRCQNGTESWVPDSDLEMDEVKTFHQCVICDKIFSECEELEKHSKTHIKAEAERIDDQNKNSVMQDSVKTFLPHQSKIEIDNFTENNKSEHNNS